MGIRATYMLELQTKCTGFQFRVKDMQLPLLGKPRRELQIFDNSDGLTCPYTKWLFINFSPIPLNSC